MTRRIRIWLLLALVVLGGASLFALPPHEIYWEYYTDASKTELCGEKWNICGSVGGYGCRTAYYIVYQGSDC
jgi:hypothetical protein